MRVQTWHLGSPLRDDAPDIVLIQQAPRLWRWRSRCARLARKRGLLVVTGGRPAAGNLLLCAVRVRVVSAYDVRLPHRSRLRRAGAVVAELEVDGQRVSVRGSAEGLLVEPT